MKARRFADRLKDLELALAKTRGTQDEYGELTRFVIPAIHPSVNEYMRWAPFVRASIARVWRSALEHAAHGMLRYTQPVDINATYHFGDKRHRDLWNYAPKFALDGLVGTILIDDNSRHVPRAEIVFGDVRKPAEMIISIRPLA